MFLWTEQQRLLHFIKLYLYNTKTRKLSQSALQSPGPEPPYSKHICDRENEDHVVCYGGCQIVIRVVVARVIKVDARVVMVVAMVI